MIKQITYTILLTLLFVSTLYAQNHKKDTLFFELTKGYIKQGVVNKNEFHIKDSSTDGTFYFEILDTMHLNLNHKKILRLKEFIRYSEYYNNQKKKKLNDYRLWEHLQHYEIFLFKKDDCYIKVRPSFVIE